MSKGRVAIVTLGCKVNKYESDAMGEILENNGYDLVAAQDVADIYIINTCSVTNMAEKKSRQMLHRMRRNNEKAIVIAVGCYVNAAREELEKDEKIDIVVGNNKKVNILHIIEEYTSKHKVEDNYSDINEEKDYENFHITNIESHTRAYVKIQDGCNQFCSYCIIPYVRGRVRSRLCEDIICEIEQLVKNGIKEIVFTGIHISSYGIDMEEDMNLLKLICKVAEISGLERIRLGSLEPRIITEEFVSTISKLEKVCPHFHLSLQSGCNKTLARMNRKYTIEEYEEGCKLLRKYYDRPALTTDIIVGFPGETKEEFEDTLAHLKRLNLYEMHIFKYSVRKGTVAEKLENQVPENIKNERSEVLLELSKNNKAAYEASFVGATLSVLFEERVMLGDKEYYTGHSKRYIKCYKESTEDICNTIENIVYKNI